MPLTDQARIAAERTAPRILTLWNALQPLQSVVSFMNTGAHPDDETSAMLAAMGRRDGIALSYACANRGEGGQNDIGTEMTEDLGALRTAEMERAAEVLDMRLYWLSQSAEDSVFDFGFSKSGVETLAKWGAERTLARMVHIFRVERPDIICPTFLNIPGQHGHHRAMTEIVHLAMSAAADPAFEGCDLPVWQVKKMYLPAWSGAGQAYDDDLPPPPATLTIAAKGQDPVSGFSWERIGQQSRAYHRTQAMGRWIAPQAERDWPLHLVQSHLPGPDDSLTAGLPAHLGALADFANAPEIAADLSAAQEAVTAARAAFPDRQAVLKAATQALIHIRSATAACPDAAKDEVLHRLALKAVQIRRVIRIAAGVEVLARTDKDWLSPGDSTALTIETRQGDADALSVEPILPAGWHRTDDTLHAGLQAVPTDAYRDSYDPLVPRAPALSVRISTHGVDSKSIVPLEVPPVVLPPVLADLEPTTAVLNTASTRRDLTVTLGALHPAGGRATLEVPAGWYVAQTPRGFDVIAPEAPEPGLMTLPLSIDGAPARRLRRMEYPHIAPTALSRPSALQVRVVEAEIPDVKVGYIGGGNDRVGHWLRAMGADCEDLDDATLSDRAALDQYDTLVIGIFAMRFRPALAQAMADLHGWVAEGGNLVTLYHRPWDNWDAAKTPPRPLEIGQPSLRWRVTDENAIVTPLIPDHPLLNGPNAIGPEDWQGWHKERGLYFAKSWDAAYAPLLEMADPDETPHKGALLAARIGAGQHVHCALILHHQMEKLVPGAFRLMANLIARPA